MIGKHFSWVGLNVGRFFGTFWSLSRTILVALPVFLMATRGLAGKSIFIISPQTCLFPLTNWRQREGGKEVGPDRTYKMWAQDFCGPGCLFSKIGLGLLLNKQKSKARGLCQKSRPARARAGPATALPTRKPISFNEPAAVVGSDPENRFLVRCQIQEPILRLTVNLQLCTTTTL
jgi:hypothetical protein